MQLSESTSNIRNNRERWFSVSFFLIFSPILIECAKNIVSLHPKINMVVVAQLVRASDCGSEGRGFETRLSPQKRFRNESLFLLCYSSSLLLRINKFDKKIGNIRVW